LNYFSVGYYAPEVDTAKGREKYKQMTPLYLASIGMKMELKFIKFSQFTEKSVVRTGHIDTHIPTRVHKTYVRRKCVRASLKKQRAASVYGADRSTISTETFKATGSLLRGRPDAILFCTELAICNSHTSHDKGDNLLIETP
jgi:hypothetical protein